jgi:hypothetical protein
MIFLVLWQSADSIRTVKQISGDGIMERWNAGIMGIKSDHVLIF